MLSGCYVRWIDNGYSYGSARKYTALTDGSTVITDRITELDIDWIGGSVTISEGDRLTVTEEHDPDYDDDKYRLHYWVDGGTLHIKYFKSGVKHTDNINKDLAITVPEDLTEIDLDVVSADVDIKGVTVKEIDCDSVSGNLELKDTEVRDINYDSVSGDIVATFSNYTPYEIDIDTVSGNADIALPDSASVRTKFNSVSGKYKSDISAGNGVEIDFDSVSGDLEITVAK